MADEDMSEEVTEFLDKKLGTEICSSEKIQSLLEDLKKKREKLNFQLQEADKATPAKVKIAVTNGQETIKEVEEWNTRKQELALALDYHVTKSAPVIEKLSTLAEEIAEMDRCQIYFSWILKLEKISQEIQGCLDAGLLGSAVETYSLLSEASAQLNGTSCSNLMKFVTDLKCYWQNLLINNLASEFDEVLKALKWPFTSQSSAPPLSTNTDIYKTLERVFILMLKLEDSLHLQPEWYFTQVLNWIRNHGDFLEHTIQPILDKTEFRSTDAKLEFISGLLMVVMEKMEESIPKLLDNEATFSHFVDETLLFDKELHTLYYNNSHDHSCLKVLTQPCCRQRWLELEKKYAIENIDTLLCQPNAFKQKYQEVDDVDDTKAPECAENFITLLFVITDRYRSLQESCHQLRFLEVQLELLEHFITKLNLEAEERSTNPLTQEYCSIVNAASYMVQILQEWADQPFFLQLQEFQKQQLVETSIEQPSKQNGNCNTNDETEPEKEENLGDSVFQNQIDVLEEMKEHMSTVLVENVLQNFKAKTKVYKKERWHNLPPQKEFIIMALSSSACDMMLFLKDKLHYLENSLSHSVFNALWRKVADGLDRFIYKEIILKSHFNEGGAAQFQFDMTKNLFVLFGEYTQKPQNFFKQVKEACILLNLRSGSAVLLGEVLKEALNNKTESSDLPSSQAAINEIGVYRLTPQEAAAVLGLRINLTTS